LIDLYSKGQYQETLDLASQLLKQFPNSFNLYNLIGVANNSIGKLEEAIVAYNKALSIKPDHAEAYNNKGNALKGQGKLDQALLAYKKALSIKADYAEAYYNIGNILQELGKSKEAIEAYKEAIAIKPDFAMAHYNIGNTFQEQDKLDEAIEAYNKVLTIKPEHVEAHNNMGVCLQDQGKLEEAIEAYNEVLSLKPDHAQTYNNATELLKTYTPESLRSLSLFKTDNKIKKLSESLIDAKLSQDIVNNLSEGLNYISEDSFVYKTPLSQIYKRNFVDLNCKRHTEIFNKKDIIPEFCFGCFKVQVEVATFVDLIKVTSLFYKLEFEENLTKKNND
jgi:tetratricopeptide (TPR) repeat protein